MEVRGVQSSRDANVTCWGGGTMANSYTIAEPETADQWGERGGGG